MHNQYRRRQQEYFNAPLCKFVGEPSDNRRSAENGDKRGQVAHQQTMPIEIPASRAYGWNKRFGIRGQLQTTSLDVHKNIAKLEEFFGRHRLGEEIRGVVVSTHKRNNDLLSFNHIANIEVAPLNPLPAPENAEVSVPRVQPSPAIARALQISLCATF